MSSQGSCAVIHVHAWLYVYMYDDIYTMNKSLNHNSLTVNSYKHTGLDVMNEVTQCAGLVSTNARSHQLYAGVTRSGCITYDVYITLLSGLKMSPETQ